MDSSDVVPDADPSESMCIIHIFDPLLPLNFGGARLRLATSESNSDGADAAKPNQQYPPSVLFDAVYGATVLHEFGVPDVRARVAEIWDELYYPRGGFDATTAKTRVQRRRERVRRDVVRDRVSRAQASCQRGEPDSLDMAMLVPYLAMGPDEIVRYFDDVDAEAMEDEHRRITEKVKRWKEDVAQSSV